MLLYFTPASLTFSIALQALMADEASKTQISSWIFVFLIALLWPVTLPCIARKKLSQKVADSQEEAAYIWIRLAE